jgi:hypothetical protein
MTVHNDVRFYTKATCLIKCCRNLSIYQQSHINEVLKSKAVVIGKCPILFEVFNTETGRVAIWPLHNFLYSGNFIKLSMKCGLNSSLFRIHLYGNCSWPNSWASADFFPGEGKIL